MTRTEQIERRLEQEARMHFLGRLRQDEMTDTCRVEVTYLTREGIERCGYFLVDVRTQASEDLADHPATIAAALVEQELERRFPWSEYRSVDDVYAI